MPKYDYRCTNCGREHEQQHKMFDAPEFSPCCNAPVVKVFHPHGVHFKGSGFYSNDSKA